VNVYLVRHAKAGSRGRFRGPDDSQRPLTDAGRAQACALAEHLAPLGITRLVSSPYARCRETLAPLAASLGIDVESSDALGEGAGPEGALAIIEATDAPVALCTHGDVVGDVLTRLDRRGVTLEGEGLAKGSIWVVTTEDGEPTRARYLPPPTT